MLGEEWDANKLKAQIQKELGITTNVKRKLTLNGFKDSFIKDLEEGRRLTAKGKPFAKGNNAFENHELVLFFFIHLYESFLSTLNIC